MLRAATNDSAKMPPTQNLALYSTHETEPPPSLAPESVIVLLSGGVDSLVVAEVARQSARNLICLEIDHPNRPTPEGEAVNVFSTETGVPVVRATLPARPGFCSMLSIASDYASRFHEQKILHVGIGVVKDDVDGDLYVGTSSYFRRLARAAAWEHGSFAYRVWTPLAQMSKREVHALADRLLSPRLRLLVGEL